MLRWALTRDIAGLAPRSKRAARRNMPRGASPSGCVPPTVQRAFRSPPASILTVIWSLDKWASMSRSRTTSPVELLLSLHRELPTSIHWQLEQELRVAVRGVTATAIEEGVRLLATGPPPRREQPVQQAWPRSHAGDAIYRLEHPAALGSGLFHGFHGGRDGGRKPLHAEGIGAIDIAAEAKGVRELHADEAVGPCHHGPGRLE
jgi:hypothetical protein